MGVLVLFLILLPISSVCAAEAPVEVIYDAGNPDHSVGVLGENLLEAGTLYEDFQVVTFQPGSIVVKEIPSQDAVTWLREGKISPEMLSRARRLFVVKQMKAIFEAQIQYFNKFEGEFSPDLSRLIDHGFLSGGFKDGVKQNYFYRIEKVGQFKKLAIQFKREAFFFASASPLDPGEDPWYFSVDQLGLVRYSKSRESLSWGPVWDYGGLNEAPPQTVITHSQEEEV